MNRRRSILSGSSGRAGIELDRQSASPVSNSASPTRRRKKRRESVASSEASSQTLNSPSGSISAGSSSVPAARRPELRGSVVGGVKVVTGFRGGVIPEYKGHMPRVGHTAIMYKRNLYIFGGVNAKGQYSSHLYCHEKRSLQWDEVRGMGVIPVGRANHTAVLYNKKMIVYGGHKDLEVFDDLFIFDLDLRRWDKVGYQKSQGPGAVFLHSATLIPDMHSMIVMGGFHQREHNRYLGHLFDIRNRVWSGIPGPVSIKPQHLQLVTTTFYEPSSHLIVIGLAEEAMLSETVMLPASVYTMNIHSFVWKRVETSTSPESPIPFRLDIVWSAFMRNFIAMGGFYDERQYAWYFPLNLDSVEEALVTTRGGQSTATSSVGTGGAKSRSEYGFFKLQVDEMTWSIVPSVFPRKVLANIAMRNHDRAAHAGVNTSWRQSAGNAPSQYQKSIQQQQQQQLMEDVGLAALSPSSRLHVPSARSSISVGSAGPMLAAAAAAGGGSAASLGPIQRLFSVQGESQMMHKYAFAAYRDSASSAPGAKPKQLQYIIMHGGLVPDENYAMLMFTPVVSRVDAFTAGKVTDDLLDSPGTESLFGIFDWEDNLLDTGSVISSAAPQLPTLRLDANRGNSVVEELEDAARAGCLLPMLPCMRHPSNAGRFAVLYHTHNSTRLERMVPSPQCPIAVLEHERDIHQWSQQYHRDTRRWLSEKLKDAAAEDRQLRRSSKKKGLGPNSATGAGTGAGGGDDSSDDEAPAITSSWYGEGGEDKGKRKLAGGGGDGVHVFNEEAFSISGWGSKATGKGGAATAPSEKRKPYKEDFFESRGLDIFNVVDLTESQLGGGGGGGERLDMSGILGVSKTSVDSAPPGLERLWITVKRHSEQQRLPSSIFQVDGGENGPHMADLGSAMAFVILRNAITSLGSDRSLEARSERAKYRWRYLRSLVRTGEAVFILYRISQEESKMKGLPVTSTPGLILAPELHLVRPTKPHKVPSRPIPYTVPHPPKQSTRFAEVCPSGMVVYHGIKHVR